MKYNTWEELYKDNRELIDFEYKHRLYNALEKIVKKIDEYQLREHEQIDTGNPYSLNQPHRDNVEKLERIYEPFYNYLMNFSIPSMEQHVLYLEDLKHNFIDLCFPELTKEGYEKERGKPHWHEEYVRKSRRAYQLAGMLDSFLYYAYQLGGVDIDFNKEVRDAYHDKLVPEVKKWDGTNKTYADKRKWHVSEMCSYGSDSILGKMVSSIYDMGTRIGYEQGIKEGLTEEEAYKRGDNIAMKYATDFVKDCFKTDSEDNLV